MDKERIDRLNAIIEHLNITKFSFANQSGIAPSNFNMMLDGKQTITDKTLGKISEAFPEINLQWLKTGEGEMLKPINDLTSANSKNGSALAGKAGRDLNQSVNTEKIFQDFIKGIKEQNSLTEKSLELTKNSMAQTSQAMAQTDKTIDMLGKTIELLGKSLNK